MNHSAAGAQYAPIFLTLDNAAAGSNDHLMPGADLGQYVCFPITKALLAFQIEYVPHRDAGSVFEQFIRIDKIVLQALRQLSPYGGFAGPHQTDQKNTLARTHGLIPAVAAIA